MRIPHCSFALIAFITACSAGGATAECDAAPPDEPSVNGTGGGGAGGFDPGAATGTGGAGGMGGWAAGDTGGAPAIPGSPTATFTVTYDGATTVELTDCASCVAGYDSASAIGVLNFAMNNASGPPDATTVSIFVRRSLLGGYEARLELLEDNPTLLDALQGAYYGPDDAVWFGVDRSSCLTLTSVDLRSGGALAGSLACTLAGGTDASASHSALVQGSFGAPLP